MKWSVFSMLVGVVFLVAGEICWRIGDTFQVFGITMVPVGIIFIAVGAVLYIRTKGEFKK